MSLGDCLHIRSGEVSYCVTLVMFCCFSLVGGQAPGGCCSVMLQKHSCSCPCRSAAGPAKVSATSREKVSASQPVLPANL